jgi:uncharacterized membrane protein
MNHLTELATWFMLPENSSAATFQVALRWVHFVAGITWVGLLYFFNLVNVPFMKQIDAAVKPTIFQYLTLPTLHLFRWTSLITVFVGFWYWGQVYVAADAHNAGVGAGSTIGLFLLIWIVASVIIVGVIQATPNPWLLAAVVLVLVTLSGWLFVTRTPVGGDDNHVLSIGIGGGLGFIMMFNVWGIIWRHNKKIIRGTLAGTPPENAAKLARQVFLASRTNFWLSFPMLFFMAASSHYPVLGR